MHSVLTTALQSSLLVAFALVHADVRADASDGDLFGYTLGDQYAESDTKPNDDGRMVLIATGSPVKPESIETVYVLATPLTKTIGKIAGEAWYASGEDAIVSYERFRSFLRNKYGEWSSEERSSEHFQGNTFSKGDMTLNVQVSGPHRDNPAKYPDRPYQLVVSLSYSVGSPAAVAFEQQASKETQQVQANEFADEDVLGL